MTSSGMETTKRLGLAVLVTALSACTAQYHARDVRGAGERKMTLGVVQKEIRKGLSQADVAEALGSPNIVTRDSAGLETWVYDKTATEAQYSNSVAYGTVLVVGVAKAAGAASVSQRTLTVVIKFSADGKVDTFSYHASRF